MKISRVGLWILLPLISIAILSWISSSIISSKLEQKIPEYEFGTFKVKVKEINVNLILGNAIIHNAQLYDTLGSGLISIPEIKLKGISLLKLLFSKKISLSQILISEPSINLQLNQDNKLILPEKSNKSSKITLKDIGRFNLSNAKLNIIRADSTEIDSIYNTLVNLDLWGISSNELQNYTFKSNSFDSVSFNLQNGTYMLPGGLYRIEYKTIGYSTSDNKLNADTLFIKSNYSKYNIGEKEGAETDWFDFKIQDFLVEDISLKSLLKDKALICSQVHIKYFEGFAFKDKRLPFPPKPDTKLPMELISTSPLLFHIDSVVIEDANVEYSERVPNSKSAGIVTFNNLTAIFKTLSNIDSLITAPTTLQASAKVMNEATLHAHFTIPNTKYPGLYTAKGQMGPMSITSFNTILKQNTSVIVESGEIKQLSFDFQYSNDHSQGNLNFEYDNLKIAILDLSQNKVKATKSFFVNNILLHKENLKEKASFKHGKISFNRNKQRSVFNFWWKSVLSGIKSIAIL